MSEIKEAFDKWADTFDTEGCEWQDMTVDRVYEQGWKDSRHALEDDDELDKIVVGDSVSINVTPEGVDDIGHRVFGVIEESQYPGPLGGRVWLCMLDQFNYTQATTVIPEGWKLVPVEPTFDMLSEIHLDASFSHHAMTVRYGAMLDAAPEAPGQEKEHG